MSLIAMFGLGTNFGKILIWDGRNRVNFLNHNFYERLIEVHVEPDELDFNSLGSLL